MSIAEYQRISIDKFMGLYARGLTDDVPPDHSSVVQNIKFNRKGECLTRDGTVLSYGTTMPVRRMFPATFGHNDTQVIVLTTDGSGNIYRLDTGGVLLNVPGMVDFFAINIFSFCLISPILSSPATSNPVYIWQGSYGNPSLDPIPIRPAAGRPPNFSSGSPFTTTESATAGNCDIGLHKFGVSFITNTGFTTRPGPVQFASSTNPGVFTPSSVTSSGGFCITLSNIPIGPSGTVARQIIATQSDQNLYFFAGGQILSGGTLVDWDGIIHDNTTTSITISFFDTDLAVSADDLFDLLVEIEGGTFSLDAGMTFYHGRVFFWGGEFNLIRVTNPGSSESISDVTGFIQLPDQFDGNDVTCASTLQDSLYFMKPVGIFSVTDNGGDPFTWSVITIDSGAGCTSSNSLGTINLATAALPQNQIDLVIDFGGLYIFTGAIQQPPLTHKINDLWLLIQSTTHLDGTTLAIDPYEKRIYIAIKGSVNFPGWPNLLVADYNDGLDPGNIKWSVWTLPFKIDSIGMIFFQDNTELAYRFRIGSNTNIYKYLPGTTTDVGQPIVCVWRSFYMTPDAGALNIYRYSRFRMPYFDNCGLTLFAEDDAFTLNPLGFNVPYVPGRDLTREYNFMDEKMAIQICCNATHGGFILQRLDTFCKQRFAMRPQV